MTEYEQICNELIANLTADNDYLRTVVRQHTSEIVNLQSEMAELRTWMERMPKVRMKAKPVKFIRDFPDFDTLTQVKAQLFHNQPIKTGHGGNREVEWNLKVGFWTQPLNADTETEWPDGTVKPCFFPLYSLPRKFVLIQDESAEPDSVLRNTIRQIEGGGADVCHLIGGRKLQEYKIWNGKTDGNQVAMLRSNNGLVIGSRQAWSESLDMGEGAAIDQVAGGPTQPVRVWNWTPDLA